MIFFLRLFLVSLFFLSIAANAQENCPSALTDFRATTQNKKINWEQFPKFSLPFTLIYGGPRFADSPHKPLEHGFTQLSSPFAERDFYLPKHQQAFLDYGTAYTNQRQPWETVKSPWGNNIELYKNKYNNLYDSYWGVFESSQKTGVIASNLFVFDIERQHKSNDSILVLKNHESTPTEIKNLTNQQFIKKYNEDLQKMYALPFEIFKEKGVQSPAIAGYSDAPILNTFINIQAFSWEKWTKDPSVINPLVYDYSKKTVGGPLYEQQSVLMPSAYYYFDYPSAFAPEYLSYLLFQIEANRAWSSKNIIPFVWLRYSFNPEVVKKPIRWWMAEATAIFPFFSGASGLWLWEDPTIFSEDANLSNYEYFTKGLYRLSEHKEMFVGDYQLVIEESAHALNASRKPIWRGISNGNYLLVAAHNPYAKTENEVISLEIKYKNWSKTIQLKGHETYLCKFDLSIQANETPSISSSFFPNPSTNEIHFQEDYDPTATLISNDGKVIREVKIENRKATITSFPSGNYILKVRKGKEEISKKISIQN
jgi:Secretion system C-terminal sorting domain